MDAVFDDGEAQHFPLAVIDTRVEAPDAFLDHEAAIDAARRVGIDLLGLSALHASSETRAGFLMGFAAYTPMEIEIAIRKLAAAFRAVAKP